jgi:hypothetical protein
MTIETILHELQAKHGNDWPRHALTELITSALQAAVGDIDATNRYTLLHAWTLTTLLAGIASRQSSDL